MQTLHFRNKKLKERELVKCVDCKEYFYDYRYPVFFEGLIIMFGSGDVCNECHRQSRINYQQSEKKEYEKYLSILAGNNPFQEEQPKSIRSRWQDDEYSEQELQGVAHTSFNSSFKPTEEIQVLAQITSTEDFESGDDIYIRITEEMGFDEQIRINNGYFG